MAKTLCGYCPCIVWLLSMHCVAIVHVFVWLLHSVATVHVLCGYCPSTCVAKIVWLLSMHMCGFAMHHGSSLKAER